MNAVVRDLVALVGGAAQRAGTPVAAGNPKPKAQTPSKKSAQVIPFDADEATSGQTESFDEFSRAA
ncbi:MAG: hypothetical protein QM702_03520 [Rubrivivax sp.]